MKKLITALFFLFLAACTPSRETPAPEVQVKLGDGNSATVATIWFDQLVTSVEIAGKEFHVQPGKATVAEITDWNSFAAAASQATQIMINGNSVAVKELQYSEETHFFRFILEDTSP